MWTEAQIMNSHGEGGHHGIGVRVGMGLALSRLIVSTILVQTPNRLGFYLVLCFLHPH